MLARITAAEAEHWCTITDISETGAKLQFVSELPRLPQHFEIQIAATRLTYRARIVWQHALEIGVCFHAPIQGEERKRLAPLTVSTG